jgi:hypothetical protein
MDTAFQQPVFASVCDKHGSPVGLEIKSVRDALFALHRQVVGNYRFDTAEWQLTARFLQDAVRDPSPENIELARDAVALLADRSPRLNS